MYLKRDKRKNGRIYLSITESYRNAEGRQRNRVVRSLGFLDDLEREWGPDALARCEQIRDEMTAEHAAAVAPVKVELHMAQKVDKRSANRMCAGDAVPLAYYDALGIETAIRSHMRGRKVEFDVNALLRLLVSERLLAPGSKHAALERAGRHFCRCDLSESDVYRGLDELSRMAPAIVSRMNASIAHAGIRDLACGYYDCTNYYFEIDDEDELRRRGVSKENRRLPIVQMGLLQDGHGIPVDFHLFPGNAHDSDTLLEALPEAKRAAGMQRVIVVADKGMNCSANIIATVAKGDGFVFSQSIRGTKSGAQLRDWAISDEGYREDGGGEFKIKSKQDFKTITIGKDISADGKAHREDVDVKIVAFWSRKHAERARHEREKLLQKAEQLVNCPGRYTKATHFGAAKYVKNIDFDEESGEVVTCAKAPRIDWEAVGADAACDGYYCIITSETDWSDERILDAYRGLWKIEESFKVTKSWLKARPVFVWSHDRIRAHFLTCYVALVLERLIEHALGHRYSAQAIIEDMRALECSELESNIWLFDHRSDLTDELFALIGEEAPRKYMRRADIKALFKKGKEVRWA